MTGAPKKRLVELLQGMEGDIQRSDGYWSVCGAGDWISGQSLDMMTKTTIHHLALVMQWRQMSQKYGVSVWTTALSDPEEWDVDVFSPPIPKYIH